MASPILKQQLDKPPSLYASPKLWHIIDDHITNYVVWRAHVHDQFVLDGMLGFIDGTEMPPSKTVPHYNPNAEDHVDVLVENPYYASWREEFDKPVKERLLSLLDQDIVPTDHEQKTCREIWVQLRERFQPLVTRDLAWGETALKVVDVGSSGEYMKLHTAALCGDKWAAKQIFENDVGEMIRNNVIARPLMPPAMRNDDKSFSVHELGGTVFPHHTSPIYARKDVLHHLFDRSRVPREGSSSYCDTTGLGLIISAIDAREFSKALSYLENAPHLAGLEISNKSALTCLASNQVMVQIQTIYLGDNIMPKVAPFMGVDVALNVILDPAVEYIPFMGRFDFLRIVVLWILAMLVFICCVPLMVLNTLYWLPWKFLKTLGFVEVKSNDKSAADDSLLLINALQLLNHLLSLMRSLPGTPEEIFRDAFILAARLGAHVVIDRILTYFPEAAFIWDYASSKYIIHMAVENRDQHLFSIVYKELRADGLRRSPLHTLDSHGNNILHLAAKLSSSDAFNKIPGSVLQIQHELKWFKEIEKVMNPHDRVRLNDAGKTPKMVFMEEHKELKDKAEKWMKDTATSCTIIAALISTIMFAAAITVPGGSDQNTGFPMFARRDFTFTLFAISDAVSFITSVISLLMFMEIMMARYEVGDFMRQLPVRLFIGLCSLFISIFFMMLSFSVAVYLVFGQPRKWVLIVVVTVTCYVVLLFGYLQGSLLLEMIGSTYSDSFIPDNELWNPEELEENSHDDLVEDPLDIA